ncbi:Intradiol ring-cleavage dioxygenase [Daedaleopsis nitida]|nr:Intradiol ring-cleavage dioxygenase [Daedaleopsis nitida]
MAQRTTSWAPYVKTHLLVRLYSAIRSTWMTFVADNPLLWILGWYGANIFDDIEGPFYMVASPSRQIDDGKAVLASFDFIKKWQPFLFVIDVKDTKGDPVPNATIDGWHADTTGGYYFSSYTLRGKATTDANGHVEILSIHPGDYGTRSGHLHVLATGVKGKHVPMTTQIYVCRGNDPNHLATDFANHWRRRPDNNMATCWYIPGANGETEAYHKFPALPADQVDVAASVKHWNAGLKDHGVDREVMAVVRHTIVLTAK